MLVNCEMRLLEQSKFMLQIRVETNLSLQILESVMKMDDMILVSYDDVESQLYIVKSQLVVTIVSYSQGWLSWLQNQLDRAYQLGK